MNNPRKMVAIFAHPDDEAFGTGGTLAKYAAEGVEVHLIMATRGEAGQSANPDIIATQPVGLLREKELRDACNCYGLAELHLLGYLDGQTALVPPSEPVFKIVEILRRLKAQVTLSFGPDGVYGHFDHLVVHRWAAAAVELAADPHKWPEAGPAHQVAKFYHRALPQPQVERMVELNGRATVDMGGVLLPQLGLSARRANTTYH
jgi:LmbE family N-acetylglucosaminyl deacetylase